jgi:hypothetical protein
VPDAQIISQSVSIGFFQGVDFFDLDMRVLKELDPNKAAQVWADVKEFGFPELGEDMKSRSLHQEVSYPGPAS